MTNPTQTIVPAANFIDAPGTFVVLPTSVAANYVGVFGSSLTRCKANFAALNSAPSSPIVPANVPVVQPGYMSAVGFPITGLQTPVADFIGSSGAYTMVTLARVPTSVAGYGSIVGGFSGAPQTNISVYGQGSANSLFSHTLYTDATGTILTLPVVNATSWNLCMFTGANGAAITGQNLTVGGSRTVVSTANAKNLAGSANTFPIGAVSSNTSSSGQGSFDIAQVLLFPSVLSTADKTAIETWCRAVAVLQGITV